MSDAKKFFKNIINNRVSGLYLILVTDLDGVQLLRVTPDDKSTDVASSFISSFVLSSDQLEN
uniref:Roadblock/LAMTOR2 domain-containing protein n=1 Tax=Megaselia scalaris TaxID=36166 RepID=T1GH02_MEGSC